MTIAKSKLDATITGRPAGGAVLSAVFSDLEDEAQVRAFSADWRAILSTVKGTFFQNLAWLDASLASKDARMIGLRVIDPSRAIVAMGLFGAFCETRHKIMTVRQWRLNETGVLPGQTTAAEYNRLLCAPDVETEAWRAVMRSLASRRDWDEIIAANASPAMEQTIRETGALIHRYAEGRAWGVDLAQLRIAGANTPEGYAASLGKNTRAQLRRAIRLYEADGPLRVARASTPEEAAAWFDALAARHEAKWRRRGVPGLVSNRHLYDFQRHLIAKHFSSIEVLRASAGARAFGWLYNFVDGDAVRYYLGGFEETTDNKRKPGLVTHALAITDHVKAGRNIYDFMIGDGRYKENLGQPGDPLCSFAIQRPSPAIRAERALRRAKHITRRLGG